MQHATHPARRTARSSSLIGACSLVLLLAAAQAFASPVCTIPDNGAGSGDLPPVGCAYDDGAGTFLISNGLPPGTEIRSDGLLQSFFAIVRTPGGSLGGETEQYQAILSLDMNGTGTLAGFHRFIGMQMQCETHAAPRVPATPVQSFATDLFGLQGQIIGDPDFDLLRITAGTGFGMPSPGHTTLTQVPGGWNVDSFFDIEYRIDFVGHPGGPLGGMSGSTTATIRMQCGQPIGATAAVARSWGRLKIAYR